MPYVIVKYYSLVSCTGCGSSYCLRSVVCHLHTETAHLHVQLETCGGYTHPDSVNLDKLNKPFDDAVEAVKKAVNEKK